MIAVGATHATLAGTLGLALGDQRDVRLLLESPLGLDGQLGSHFCGCCRSRTEGQWVRLRGAIVEKYRLLTSIDPMVLTLV